MQQSELVAKLESVRERAARASEKKSILEGEANSLRARRSEIEAQCRKQFECDVKELPSLISELESAAQKSLAKAESLLGDSPSDGVIDGE